VKVRAWLHLHTTCSGDADLTYEQLVAAARAAGISALFLTEHREAMDDEGIEASVRRCRERSGEDLVLVPGLEIASDERYHVLGFGLARAVAKGPATEMAARMRQAGALPVLAHPSRYRPGWEETLGAIGAVEVWNRHYDGRVAPPSANVAACREKGVRPLFGLDAHGAEALTGALPEMLLDVPALGEAALIEALREGRCETAIDGRALDPCSPGGLRSLAGSGYRGLRRLARRLACALPLSADTRKRLGRKW
jgi:hypothetical protein